MNGEIAQIGGKTYKKCKVVMLPTEKAEGCILRQPSGNMMFTTGYFTQEYLKQGRVSSEHLYILSFEEIKQPRLRWIMDYRPGMNGFIHQAEVVLDSRWCPEIIATTNRELKFWTDNEAGKHVWSLPRPSNEFMIAYCKNGGNISEVLVEHDSYSACPHCQLPYDDSTDGKCVTCRKSGLSVRISTIKTSPDNTITIKPVPQNTYSESELLDFVQWYSGMHRSKVERALDKYKREKEDQ